MTNEEIRIKSIELALQHTKDHPHLLSNDNILTHAGRFYDYILEFRKTEKQEQKNLENEWEEKLLTMYIVKTDGYLGMEEGRIYTPEFNEKLFKVHFEKYGAENLLNALDRVRNYLSELESQRTDESKENKR